MRRIICQVCDRGFDRSSGIVADLGWNQMVVCGELCRRTITTPSQYEQHVARGTGMPEWKHSAIERALLARVLSVAEIAQEFGVANDKVSRIRSAMVAEGRIEPLEPGESNNALKGLRNTLRGRFIDPRWRNRVAGAARRKSERAHARRGEAAQRAAKTQEGAR